MQVTADADRVPGLPHRTDPLTGVDAFAAMNQRQSRHVSVEVSAVLTFTVNQQVVAVENRVVSGAEHPAVANRNQRRAAGGDDVEPFMPATTTARRTELTDVAARAVRTINGKDMVTVGKAAVVGGCLT